MNREIKFRAWNLIFEKMSPEHAEFHFNGEHSHLHFDVFNGNFDTDVWGFSECKLMQYTGVKDKNGVEIYEGDIVNFPCDGDNLNFVVSMLKGACFAAHRKSNDSDFYFLDDFEYSVVGNIYENPELINP